MPTCEALAAGMELEDHSYDTIYECVEKKHHTEWYWILYEDGGLSHENAYAISLAMHVDLRIPFHDVKCTVTPDSPDF